MATVFRTGFTSFCEKNDPELVVETLQGLVENFEKAFEDFGLEKIKTVRRKFPNLPIQVDGGINSHTIGACVEAGASRFVSGSTLFNANDPASLIRSWRENDTQF